MDRSRINGPSGERRYQVTGAKFKVTVTRVKLLTDDNSDKKIRQLTNSVRSGMLLSISDSQHRSICVVLFLP